MRSASIGIILLLNVIGISPVLAFYGDGLLVNSTIMNFEFTEFDDTGELVNENGILMGGELEVGKAIYGPVWGAIRGSILKGTVDYDGETVSDGRRHQTKTEQTIYDFTIEIGRNYETWRRHEFATIYAGLGFHQWVRDIKTKDKVIGLYERYSWAYANVGARGFLFRTENSHVMVEINLLRTINPFLDVSFKGNLDDKRYNLGEHYGAKISIPWRYEITRRIMFYTEFYFEAWDLGFSEVEDATLDGFVVGTTQSPRNNSRFSGVNLGLFLRFD